MKAHTFRSLPDLLPLAALLLASGLAQAIEPPRVMFVSGLETMPVIIDLQGKETLAKKGQVIPPGYSVKVPAGATVQIMTDEKAIVAVRQNSLLKLEKLGDGGEPHKFKLDVGGLRVANSEKKPHKFEVDTPNAKITFDKGDHEAFYIKDGNKVTEGRWGTFVRGFKDEAVLSTQDGDTKVERTKVGYVPGASKDGKTELIDRIKVGGNALTDPVGNIFSGGSIGQAVSDLNDNQRVLSENAKSPSPDLKTMPPAPERKGDIGVAPIVVGTFAAPKEILPPKLVTPITPVAGLSVSLQKLDVKTLANLNPPKVPDPNSMRQIKIGTLSTGEKVVVDLRPQSIGVVSQDPAKSQTFRASDLGNIGATATLPKLLQDVTCSGRSCLK